MVCDERFADLDFDVKYLACHEKLLVLLGNGKTVFAESVSGLTPIQTTVGVADSPTKPMRAISVLVYFTPLDSRMSWIRKARLSS